MWRTVEGSPLQSAMQGRHLIRQWTRQYSDSSKGWGYGAILERGRNLLSKGEGGGTGLGAKLPRPRLIPLSELRGNVKENFARVVTERMRGFWQRNKHIVLGVSASFAVYYIWRTTYGVASMFIDLTETFAEMGFLALSVAMTGAFYLYIRERSRINPNKLFRMAMTRLNTSPAVLEVMGAPLTGSHLQASVLSGGGLRVKGYLGSEGVKIRSTRLHMIFPVAGPEARGVVSIEAKKKRGKHQFKLLAVDVVTKSGLEERIFLDGDESYYRRGGILSELRDPFLKVAAAQTMYEIEDDEEERAAIAANVAAKSERASSAGETGQEKKQIYFYEWGWEYLKAQLSSVPQKLAQKPVQS
ncbi:hypothetical protein HOP50_09g54580 [Chloropicon primus]|uniref:Uncharacterized protein n=1 Tax=Chloropicon primus TaxID=1764295 RepID=A0A5B8MQU0_9CHLO|nr:hypothetical protein A3770_09p54270 [Chloropicon primus]UPR02133.1 hypothetical protein HOP50_09g54580 [Chloropicon primus]|eukprot:QDZ22909.1 hypothetical protein A3770_09p54270 [Chloropicon primus]